MPSAIDLVAKIGAGVGVLAIVITLITGSVYTAKDEPDKRKTGIALLSTSGGLVIIGLLIAAYVRMPERYGGGRFFTYVSDFLPPLLLMGGIVGLFYLITPSNDLTDDLKNLQKRTGVVAGVASAILIMTAVLAVFILQRNPAVSYIPYIMTMSCFNFLVAILALVSAALGKE